MKLRFRLMFGDLDSIKEQIAALENSENPDFSELKRLHAKLRSTLEDLCEIEELSPKNIPSIEESQQRFQSIYEKSPLGIAIIDNQGRYIDVNPSMTTILGYSREELFRMNFSEITHPEDLEVDRKLTEQIFKREIPHFQIEKRFIAKNGAVLWGSLTAAVVHNAQGKAEYGIGMIENISERKNAEKTLRRSQHMLKSINQNIQEGIYRSTGSSGLIYVNDAFVKMFGYASVEETLQTDPSNFYYDPEDRDRIGRFVETTGSGSNLEVRFKKKNGTVFWAAMSSTITHGAFGETYFDGAIRDISLEKKAQVQLREAKDRAEEMNEMKSNFLANMSHEIRTPINGIIGLAEIMEDEFQDNPQMAEYTSLLKQSGERLLNTITSILDLSKIEAQRMKVELKQVNFCKVLRESLPEMQQLSARKGISLTYTELSNEGWVKIDVDVLQQIISNLVRNAIKFTREGEVRLQVDTVKKGDSSQVLCTVMDTGIGISEEYLPHIFSSFSQESSGLSRQFEGSGLGLAIVKRYLEMFGGTIHVSSKKHEGSIFTFTLPACRPAVGSLQLD